MNVCPQQEILGWNFTVSAVKFPTLKMMPSSHSFPFFIVPSKVVAEEDEEGFAWRENLLKLDTNQRKMEWNLLIPSPVIYGALLISAVDQNGKPIRYMKEIPFIVPQDTRFNPTSNAMFVLSQYQGRLFAKESKTTLDILSLFSSQSDSIFELFWPAVQGSSTPLAGAQVALVEPASINPQDTCVPVLFDLHNENEPIFCVPWTNSGSPNNNDVLMLPDSATNNKTPIVRPQEPESLDSTNQLFLIFGVLLLICVTFVLVFYLWNKSKSPKIIHYGPKTIGIGKLKIFLDQILGKGSCGTIVFLGEYEGRQVAVKRILKEFYELAQKEIAILLESDHHDNMVTYYSQEQDDQFIYLALSYCPTTLGDVIEKLIDTQKLQMLRQLSKAVTHLHGLNIVHKDIKPQNVLLDSSNKYVPFFYLFLTLYRIQLSDMGLAKKLAGTHGSISFNAHEGSIGWEAPEIILFRLKSKGTNQGPFYVDVPQKHKGKKGKPKHIPLRITKKVDIFSLGCVFYYVLTGEHPFGDQ
jgi:hypothetical protein